VRAPDGTTIGQPTALLNYQVALMLAFCVGAGGQLAGETR
jgi:hypothetical protein